MSLDPIVIVGIFIIAGIAVIAGIGWTILQRIKNNYTPETENIEDKFRRVLNSSGIEQSIGEIKSHVNETKGLHRSISDMLRAPKESADFGELSLETIISDQLSPDMFGIREKIPNGKNPDIHIRSHVGIICIDSKFPRDNYRHYCDAQEPDDKKKYKRDFIRNVRIHLEKVAQDYVQPQNGTADFAFAYIPSEAIYYFLVTEAYELLREFTRKGVQAVSPLTLSHKLELIKAGVHSKKLNEQAQEVQRQLQRIAGTFESLDGLWKTFFSTHLHNAWKKAQEVDEAYLKLREDFEDVRRADNTDEN